MYRYLALIWNPADREAASSARLLAQRARTLLRNWQCVMDAGGITAFHSGLGEGAAETRLLEQSSGVIFGTIFNRNIESVDCARRVVLGASESEAIVAGGGRRLFERYWGRYVALIRDAGTGEVWMLRDPMGQLPCLLTTFNGVSVVFSDFEDCLKLGTLTFSINWKYVAGCVAYPTVMTAETGLNEVSEIQLGERVRFAGGKITRTMEWRPFDIARTDPILDVESAVTQTRNVVRACVHTWASCYRGIIHNLSGGLDSSIVLSCLVDAPNRPPVTCLNYYGSGPQEDERVHAERMAKHANVELVESFLDPANLKLEQIVSARCSARPWFYIYELEHTPLELGLAKQRGAQALFSGAGGDGVFFQARAELAVSDYLYDHGLGGGLLRTAVDAAQVARKSVWSLLFTAGKSRVSRKKWNPMSGSGRPARTLIGPEVIASAGQNQGFQHPWFTDETTKGVPPGTLWHVASVCAPPGYYGFFGSETVPERVLPLMSQPLIELCLRMPTYMLIKSGRDRAIARRAFAADLPSETIRRSGKGRVDQHLRNVLDSNLPFVREYLLDGIMVNRGLLNREVLERYLTKEVSPSDFEYTEILQEHMCMETWLRRSLDLPKPAQVPDGVPPNLTSSFGPAG